MQKIFLGGISTCIDLFQLIGRSHQDVCKKDLWILVGSWPALQFLRDSWFCSRCWCPLGYINVLWRTRFISSLTFVPWAMWVTPMHQIVCSPTWRRRLRLPGLPCQHGHCWQSWEQKCTHIWMRGSELRLDSGFFFSALLLPIPSLELPSFPLFKVRSQLRQRFATYFYISKKSRRL